MQQAALICFAQGLGAGFCSAMPFIVSKQKWDVEKHLFSFRLTNAMFIGALSGVAFVPLETFHEIQIEHVLYITVIYNCNQPQLVRKNRTSCSLAILQSADEVAHFFNGGILPYMLRQLMAV